MNLKSIKPKANHCKAELVMEGVHYYSLDFFIWNYEKNISEDLCLSKINIYHIGWAFHNSNSVNIFEESVNSKKDRALHHFLKI